MVIGGEDVRTGKTFEQVDAARARQRARRRPPGRRLPRSSARSPPPARRGTTGRRLPWEERAAVFLRAAELLAGPWRATLERRDDARPEQDRVPGRDRRGLRADRLPALQRRVLDAHLRASSPISSPGVWNRMEYRPLEGFVFAVTPFNFTAIGGNLPTAPALMGNTVVWKPALDRRATPRTSSCSLFQEAGLPPGVINFVYGPGAAIGDAGARRSRELAGVHFTGSTAVFQLDVEDDRRATSTATAATRASSARPAARTSSSRTRRPTSTRSRSRSCAARSSTRGRSARPRRASTSPSNLWPALRDRLADADRRDPAWATSPTSRTSWAPSSTRRRSTRPPRRDRARRASRDGARRSSPAAASTTREGWFVEPTVDRDERPGLPAHARGDLRPGA